MRSAVLVLIPFVVGEATTVGLMRVQSGAAIFVVGCAGFLVAWLLTLTTAGAMHPPRA